MLFRDGNPIILDAECATMGDASFDVAFCLIHLILKAILLPSIRGKLLDAALALWQAYRSHIRWENPDQLEQRICTLLSALMLARVDGKSPVEYFNDVQVQVVRAFSLSELTKPIEGQSLNGFVHSITRYLQSSQTSFGNET